MTVMKRRPRIWMAPVVVMTPFLLDVPEAQAASTVVVTCPFSGVADHVDRGFYVSGYSGTNLDTVTLNYTADTAGSYNITLSARLGAYNGTVIGTAAGSANIAAPFTSQDVVFSFGAAPVAAGSTIAFSQSFTGPGGAALYFDVGNGPLGDPAYSGCPSVFETEGTIPPLDVFRRASVGLSITQLTIPAPTITSFTPTVGPIGTSVVIAGTNFTGTGFTTSAVLFHGVSSTFTVNSPTQITATVPAGATTGPISVTTPGGTATSATNFTIQTTDQTPVEKHRSNVTLKLSGHLVAKGEVNVPDGTKACERGRVVKVQKRKGGSWRTVRTDRTNSTGAYRASLPDGEGTYRSLVKKDRMSDKDVCLDDVSRTRKHNHPEVSGGGSGGGGGTQNCTAGYSPCLVYHGGADYDCAGGSGNGPYYTEPGVVYTVSGSDPYGLDADNDGRGCE